MNKKVLIVGAGFYGAIMAREIQDAGHKVLVIDKRKHIGGNCYTDKIEGIDVHKYGPHIFHTNDKSIWSWITKYTEMENYIFSPTANYNNELYSLPFNLWTFYQLWGISNPDEVLKKIESQSGNINNPKNLEEQAIKLVGLDVYEKLIKGYTTKQWNCDPKKLPNSIIKRLPVRLTFNSNYFNDEYQGIPKYGYTKIFENLLKGIEVKLEIDFFRLKNLEIFDKIIYTGPIDLYYNYKFGKLKYRSLKWETESFKDLNYQGNSVVNYTSSEIPFTRIIEHKHFIKTQSKLTNTIISKEFPVDYNEKNEPFYPVNDQENSKIYSLYEGLSKQEEKVHFGGRLGKFKYYDMHQVIASSLSDSKKILSSLSK